MESSWDGPAHKSPSHAGDEQHGEDEGDGKVEHVVQPQEKGSSQQQERSKPLIEEL